MTPENVVIAFFCILIFVILRGLLYMFRMAEREKKEDWRILELERELARQSEFTHDLQQQTLRRIAGQYSEERAQGVLGCGCRCHCDCNESPKERPPLRIHMNQPYVPQSPSRREWQPEWVQPESDDSDEEWFENEIGQIAYQQVPLLGKNWVGQLVHFSRDDVIDMPTDDDPPLAPLEPYEPPRKRGQPRKYATDSERQRAWRERQKKKKQSH